MYVLPKTVWISGEKWLVVRDGTKQGSSAVWDGKPKITIGTLGGSEEYLLSEYIHEVLEAILMTRHMRYGTNSTMFFLFDHKEFETIITDIVTAVKGCWRKTREVKRGRTRR